MWRNGNPRVFAGSDCDFTLLPLSWQNCPVAILPNYLSAGEVASCKAVIARNSHHAICNLAYSPTGAGKYLPAFRRSADLNRQFFPEELWERVADTALDLAITKYGSTHAKDARQLSGGHQFATIYQPSAGNLALHADGGARRGEVWRATVTTRYEMSTLVYLTSQGKDFTGGTLRFPYLLDSDGRAFEYAPEAGTAVVFPANPQFAHSVDASVGNRMLLGSWNLWRPYAYSG